MSIGRVHIFLKNWPEATGHLFTAIELWRDSSNKGVESRALFHLGDALPATGLRDEARNAFTQCLALDTPADPIRLTHARKRLTALDAG
ncbi:tol-pal system YbgF family protein [Streptomyces sp. NPDC001315]|uniref:tetratricopeptide repeat protein n=1 Tax=Streptomyces sp. NPDC001315 TaxID=3364562 RepID=UPI0036B07411